MSTQVFKTYTAGEFHYVFGEVYAPDIVDTDGESMTAEDIRKMAHDFIATGKVKELDTNHNHKICGAEVVESFIARSGDPDFAEGAWVLGVRMPDGPLWEMVKSGEINSFSVDTLVTKVQSDRNLPNYSVSCGTTLEPVEQFCVPKNKALTRNSRKCLKYLARLERFELPTNRFVACYSIQLSYKRLTKRFLYKVRQNVKQNI